MPNYISFHCWFSNQHCMACLSSANDVSEMDSFDASAVVVEDLNIQTSSAIVQKDADVPTSSLMVVDNVPSANIDDRIV